MTTNFDLTRGRSPSDREGDDESSKRYTFGSNPPRHTAGGLLSSWLVDQQNTSDGLGDTAMCTSYPSRPDGLVAVGPTVLKPGMAWDSLACRSVKTMCREALTYPESRMGPRPRLCDSRLEHTVVVIRLPVYVVSDYRPCMTTGARLPSLSTTNPNTHQNSVPVPTNFRQKTSHGTGLFPPWTPQDPRWGSGHAKVLPPPRRSMTFPKLIAANRVKLKGQEKVKL